MIFYVLLFLIPLPLFSSCPLQTLGRGDMGRWVIGDSHLYWLKEKAQRPPLHALYELRDYDIKNKKSLPPLGEILLPSKRNVYLEKTKDRFQLILFEKDVPCPSGKALVYGLGATRGPETQNLTLLPSDQGAFFAPQNWAPGLPKKPVVYFWHSSQTAALLEQENHQTALDRYDLSGKKTERLALLNLNEEVLIQEADQFVVQKKNRTFHVLSKGGKKESLSLPPPFRLDETYPEPLGDGMFLFRSLRPSSIKLLPLIQILRTQGGPPILSYRSPHPTYPLWIGWDKAQSLLFFEERDSLGKQPSQLRIYDLKTKAWSRD